MNATTLTVEQWEIVANEGEKWVSYGLKLCGNGWNGSQREDFRAILDDTVIRAVLSYTPSRSLTQFQWFVRLAKQEAWKFRKSLEIAERAVTERAYLTRDVQPEPLEIEQSEEISEAIELVRKAAATAETPLKVTENRVADVISILRGEVTSTTVAERWGSRNARSVVETVSIIRKRANELAYA